MKQVTIQQNNLDTLNDRMKQLEVQEERVHDLQQHQADKIEEWKAKILQLDMKALKQGLDLGSDFVKGKEKFSLPESPLKSTLKSNFASPTPSSRGKVLSRQPSMESALSIRPIVSNMIYTQEMTEQRNVFMKNRSTETLAMANRDDIEH